MSKHDILDMEYINSLPQPFIGCMWGNREWPVYDIEIETGLVRIDVCGMLDVKHIGDFKSFVDATGASHPSDGFFIGATAGEREFIKTGE